MFNFNDKRKSTKYSMKCSENALMAGVVVDPSDNTFEYIAADLSDTIQIKQLHIN